MDLETLVHAISHDLRSPLTAVQGFADLLLEEPAKAFEPKQIRHLELIAKSARRMNDLIGGLLHFFALSRNKIEFSTITTKEIVEETWDELSGFHQDERARLVVKDSPDAKGDSIMIRQVFLNLFENALKFRRPQAMTIIEVGGRAETGMNVYYVKDNGIGFPNEQAQKILGVFERLNRTEKYEGTGLGLSIVKRIIERHGGRVWAEGKENVSATFYFTLPSGYVVSA